MATYGNGTGSVTPTLTSYTSYVAGGTADPQFNVAGSGDFSLGTNLKGLGYPTGGSVPIGQGAYYSYVDPGAAGRCEPGYPTGRRW